MNAAKDIFSQYAVDMLQMTLNEELGFGYDRIVRFTKKWEGNWEKYIAALSPHINNEADVAQERIDREFVRIVKNRKGAKFYPFRARYPLLRKIKY